MSNAIICLDYSKRQNLRDRIRAHLAIIIQKTTGDLSIATSLALGECAVTSFLAPVTTPTGSAGAGSRRRGRGHHEEIDAKEGALEETERTKRIEGLISCCCFSAWLIRRVGAFRPGLLLVDVVHPSSREV